MPVNFTAKFTNDYSLPGELNFLPVEFLPGKRRVGVKKKTLLERRLCQSTRPATGSGVSIAADQKNVGEQITPKSQLLYNRRVVFGTLN